MRRRRRINTQTISRKTHTTIIRPSTAKKRSFNFGKLVIYIFFITLIGYGGFWVVTNSDQFLGSFSDSVFTDLSEVGREERPRLPAEEDKPGQGNALPVYSPIQKKTQVEVLNGCGVKGIAKLIADRLKQHDYDVVNRGNYLEKGRENFNVKKSRLIDQLNTSDNLANTRDLAEILGIELGNIESLENVSPIADISIIIGRDYKKLKIFK